MEYWYIALSILLVKTGHVLVESYFVCIVLILFACGLEICAIEDTGNTFGEKKYGNFGY